MKGRILVVDDREGIRSFIAATLEGDGHSTATAGDGHEAMARISKEPFDLLITDLKMPRMDGMKLLEAARRADPGMPVIILTAHGTIDNAVEAMKLGAFDYLTKPLEGPTQLRLLVARALEHRTAQQGGAPSATDNRMVAVDPASIRVLGLIDKVAPTGATVLLLGESGTGKEVAAREIHLRSQRRDKPFVAINCAAISPQLVESEMFGHEKGAFTGADQRREGRFESADGGTLFLDEIGELPLELQPKLLRVLQEMKLERVGGTGTIEVDVRIVAATNRSLEEQVARGAFREDLYHRLCVFPIALLPLRERRGDIPPLTQGLLADISRRLGKGTITLGQTAMGELLKRQWPGNVRELGNVLQRAAILCEGGVIEAADLWGPSATSSAATGDDVTPLKDLEKDAIRRALDRNDGHRKKAADELGIALRTLYNKIKEYGLE